MKSLYLTQALADIAALPDISLTANQGAVDIPDNVSVGWVWDTTDAKWREPGFGDLSELNQRKSAARTLHDALLGWEAGVLEVRHEKPTLDVNRAFDFLCYAHWANYIVFTNVNDSWTAAQQIAWAFAMTLGAADITTVQEFFQHAHSIDDNEVPQEACAWVNPNDAVAVITEEARLRSTQETEGMTPWFDGEETDFDDDRTRKRCVDRGHHIMLPTLGQLITPTTDVTVEESYEIATLDSDGSRRVLDRKPLHDLLNSSDRDRGHTDRTQSSFGGPPISQVFIARSMLPHAKAGISPTRQRTASPSSQPKPR